jgi:bacteriocin biosynthesis cyclodehydratase domain-containing protein
MNAPHITVPIDRPIFKEKYCLEAVSGGAFFLVSENEAHVLEGPNLQHVVPLIDGQRRTDEIVRLLCGRMSAQEVYDAVNFLMQAGHVREADPMVPPHFAAFWTELGADTRQLPALFAHTPIQVLTLGTDADPALYTTVQAFGLHISPIGRILLVAVDDYLDPRLEQINRACLESQTPWLLFKPDGVNIWVGPLFVPSRTPCWSCLAVRLRDNREVESYVRTRDGRTGPLPTTRARLWPTRQQAYSMAVTQLVRWIVTGNNSVLESHLVIAETVSFAFSYHPVVRRPQCENCGDPRVMDRGAAPISFQERHENHVTDSGERHAVPEVTFERFRHHISAVTGIVRGLQPSPWQNVSPLRTYVAGHNFALKNDSLFLLKDGLRTSSSGKGRTDAQAKTGALCEALERYSGVYQGDEPHVSASFQELGEAAIHPNRCMLFSETQYREREKWLSRGSRFQVVPLPFDETALIDWSPVHSFSEKRTKYLPTSYLYYGYPHREDQFYCWADSNGNAAGTTIEDACLQAFYEIVERDGVCIWWYNQVPRPEVDLESFHDPYVTELREFYAAMGREFWILDVSTDVGIPVFVAVNRRTNGPTEDIILGFGAHMNARVAATRALTEMNQFMPSVLNVAPDGNTRYGLHDKDAIVWWRSATVLNQPYLLPLVSSSKRRLTEYGSAPEGTILQRLLACFTAVEKLGMEVLVLDQTRPDIGLSVVKVIVPGMRHFWARFAPGRLYDVPVQAGWLKFPTVEEYLNPVAMFL